MHNITVYISDKAYSGYITIDAWDDKDDMYPLLWHIKFMDYTISEIKQKITEMVKNKLGEGVKFKITWERQR